MNQNFAVSAGHESVVEAAKEILKAGGNAFDAAVAAFTAGWIAEPCMTGAGGGAFANLITESGETFLLDFFCQTPKRKRPSNQVEFFPIEVNFGTATEIFHIGKGSTAVPGAVAGMFALHEQFGTIPMKELIQPAIDLAKNGVIINNFQYLDFELLETILRHDSKAESIYFENGKLKPVGQKMFMPQLADFLDYLSREGQNAFYQGEIARKIADDYQNGGFLRLEDLKDYEVIFRKSLTFPYRNKKILTNPLPSIGGSLMSLFLNYSEKFDLPEKLISNKHLTQIYKAFKYLETIEKSPENLDSELRKVFSDSGQSKRGATTHINIADQKGNAVSLTSSLGEGCGYFIEGTDIQLNNMLGESALLPDGFHSWKPNVRLSSMMAPTLVLDEFGKPEIVTGSGGAGRIPFAIAQVLKNLIDYKMSVPNSVNAPRIHLDHGILNVEKEFGNLNISDEIQNVLKTWKERSLFFGGVHTIQIKNKTMFAVGDNRRDGVGFESLKV